MTFQYPTGHGRSHTHAKILSCGSKNPSTRAGESYDPINLPEIRKLALNPPSVSKDEAQWFIPSEYCGYDARNQSAQREKGSFRFLTLDVDDNNLSISSIDEIVSVVIGQAYRIIYSSRSATEKLKKWRVLVPLANPIAGSDFADTQNAFFDLLEDASKSMLIPDRALARPAQLVYLPNKGEFYQVQADPSKVLKLAPDHAIIRHREAKRSATDRAQPEAAAPSEMQSSARMAWVKSDGVSLIDHFNSVHPVAKMLERYGYKQRGSSNDWRSPFQSSDRYATRDLGERWLSLSASDAAQGVGAETKNGNRHGDAFDLYCHFEHGSDFKAALRAYSLEVELDHEEPIADTGQRGAPQTHDDGPPVKPEQSPEMKSAAVFQFTPVSDLRYRSPEYIIGELIETDTLGLMFGDPGCGKSFLAVDIALSVATGTSFHGRETKQGSVFFIAGEGHSGLARRFAAWSQARDVPLAGVPLFKSERAAQFLDGESAKAVSQAVAELAGKHGSPSLIVIDTLARNFGAGDENNTRDMNEFVAAVDDLKARFPGCSVLIVHHSGHAEKQRARGAMALKGALDCEYRVEKKDRDMKLINTKMKDAEPPPDLHFSFKQVDLDEQTKSAALEAAEAPKDQHKLTSTQRLAQETYITAAVQSGVWDKTAFRGVQLEDWRAAFYAKHTGDNAGTKRQAFSRVRKDLSDVGIIAVEIDLYLWRDTGVEMAIIAQRDKRNIALQSEKCNAAESGDSVTCVTNA